MTRIAIIGAGSVGRALGAALTNAGHDVVYGVRDATDPRHAGSGSVAGLDAAADGASVVILAVPADSVTNLIPRLGLVGNQIVLDATNAVRTPVPDGFATMADVVASLVPDGVHVAKAFNTVGAEHLGNGTTEHGSVFLPVSGDEAAATAASELAADLGFDVVVLGGRDRFAMQEDHARLWIHLAFGCGWGRDFAFTAVRR